MKGRLTFSGGVDVAAEKEKQKEKREGEEMAEEMLLRTRWCDSVKTITHGPI